MDSPRPVRTPRRSSRWLVGGALAVLMLVAPALAAGSVASTARAVPPVTIAATRDTSRVHLDALPVAAANGALYRAGARAVAWEQAAARNRYLAAAAAEHVREISRISSRGPRDSRPTSTTSGVRTTALPESGPWESWPDWPLWHCTALHESGHRPGSPPGSVWWTNEAGRYSGAFDIARTTWQANAGQYAREYPDAGQAPPEVQILGARLVRAAVGSSEWGGLRACGG